MKTDIICEMEKMSETDKQKLIDLAECYGFLKACGIKQPKGTVTAIKDLLDKYEIGYIDDILGGE